MELSRSSCRICLLDNEFNVALFGSFCRRTNMVDKILECLNLVIEETDLLTTICYKCADTVERYYEFTTFVKKCQTKLGTREIYKRQRNIKNDSLANSFNMRHITSYVREQVYDADYTFSFLETNNIGEKKEAKSSSPCFSYLTPNNVVIKQSNEPTTWKTPQTRCNDGPSSKIRRKENFKKQCKPERSQHHSRDLFESQTQDSDDQDPGSFDWKPISNSNFIKRVREKCFGRSDF